MLLLASSAASLSSPLGGLLVRGDHSPSDVYFVGDPPGGVDSVEQSGRRLGRPRRAWIPGRGRRPTPACRWAGLGSGSFIPVVPCPPRPQFAVIPPGPAGEEGAVHHVVAALGHLLRGEQQVL